MCDDILPMGAEEPEPEQMTKEDLEPGTREHPKEWGIWDTKDKSWIGTCECALTYGNNFIAQVGAQTLETRLGMPMGRLRARRFTGANVKGEDLVPQRTWEEAFNRVMGEE